MIDLRQQEIVDLGLWAKVRWKWVGWDVKRRSGWGADDSVGVRGGRCVASVDHRWGNDIGELSGRQARSLARPARAGRAATVEVDPAGVDSWD